MMWFQEPCVKSLGSGEVLREEPPKKLSKSDNSNRTTAPKHPKATRYSAFMLGSGERLASSSALSATCQTSWWFSRGTDAVQKLQVDAVHLQSTPHFSHLKVSLCQNSHVANLLFCHSSLVALHSSHITVVQESSEPAVCWFCIYTLLSQQLPLCLSSDRTMGREGSMVACLRFFRFHI